MKFMESMLHVLYGVIMYEHDDDDEDEKDYMAIGLTILLRLAHCWDIPLVYCTYSLD